MKVGVIGSGDVAKVLASGCLKHGHPVCIGTRSPEKLKEWAGENKGATVSSFAGAAEFGELIMLAVKGNVAADALRQAGAKNLAGKAVMDACNPIARRASGERGAAIFHNAQ